MAFCTEFQAVYDSWTTKPDAWIADAYDTAVRDLITLGVWSKFDVFYYFGIHTNANGEALKNWKSPSSFVATLSNNDPKPPPVFTAHEGFKGDSTTGPQVQVPWNPTDDGVNYTLNNCAIGYFENIAHGLSGERIYNIDGTYEASVFQRYTNDRRYVRLNYNGNNYSQYDERIYTAGLWIDTIQASSLTKAYRNGVEFASSTVSPQGLPSQDALLLAAYPTTTGEASNGQLRLWFAGAALSQSESAGITTILQTLIGTIAAGQTANFCSQFQAVYNSWVSKPPLAVANAMDTFVRALVDSGIWAKIDLLHVFGVHANGSGEALVNWKSPSEFYATLYNNGGVDPTFAAYEGFSVTDNGVNKGVISINWVASTDAVNYAQNSAAVGWYSRTQFAEVGQRVYNLSLQHATLNPFQVYPYSTSGNRTTRANTNTSNSLAFARVPTIGFFVDVVEASTTVKAYKNGELIGSTTSAPATTGVPEDAGVFFGEYLNGTYYPSADCSLFFTSSMLTQSEIQTFTNAFEAYMDSNSKGVIEGSIQPTPITGSADLEIQATGNLSILPKVAQLSGSCNLEIQGDANIGIIPVLGQMSGQVDLDIQAIGEISLSPKTAQISGQAELDVQASGNLGRIPQIAQISGSTSLDIQATGQISLSPKTAQVSGQASIEIQAAGEISIAPKVAQISGLCDLDIQASGAMSADALATGAVSYWKLDETSGNAIDSIGDNNGVPSGIGYNQAGKVNKAFSFNGNDSYVNFGNPANLAFGEGSFSISFWFKTAADQAITNARVLFNGATSNDISQAGYCFFAATTNINFAVNPSGVRTIVGSGAILTPDTWNHVVGVVERGHKMSIYINGVLVGSAAAPVGSVSSIYDLELGRANNQASYLPYKGSLDEVKLWKRALSSEEALEDYNNGVAGLELGTKEAQTSGSASLEVQATGNLSILPKVAQISGSCNIELQASANLGLAPKTAQISGQAELELQATGNIGLAPKTANITGLASFDIQAAGQISIAPKVAQISGEAGVEFYLSGKLDESAMIIRRVIASPIGEVISSSPRGSSIYSVPVGRIILANPQEPLRIVSDPSGKLVAANPKIAKKILHGVPTMNLTNISGLTELGIQASGQLGIAPKIAQIAGQAAVEFEVLGAISEGFHPLDAGIELWYDASDASTVHLSGNRVFQWDDKSGHGYNAAQGVDSVRPTYDSGAVYFEAARLTQLENELPSNLYGDVSFIGFIVSERKVFNSTKWGRLFSSFATLPIINEDFQAPNYAMTGVYDGSGNQIVYPIQIFSANGGGDNRGLRVFNIGRSYKVSSQALEGHVYEIQIYRYTGTFQYVTEVTNYLSAKWGI